MRTHFEQLFRQQFHARERSDERDEMGDFSDGSDIDDADYSFEEENGIDPNCEAPPEPLLKAQWMFYFFPTISLFISDIVIHTYITTGTQNSCPRPCKTHDHQTQPRLDSKTQQQNKKKKNNLTTQ